MRCAFIVLLAGIALQGAGAVALIAWWTREGSAPAARSDRPSPPDPGAAGGRAQGDGRGDEARAGARVERVSRVPTFAAAHDALSFRREMKVGLAALRERVAAAGCGAEGASFTLDLETVEGGIQVVEARLEPGGAAGEEGVACARAALLGETIAAPSAAPGRRWQISFAP